MPQTKKKLNTKGKIVLVGKLIYLVLLGLVITLLLKIFKMNVLPTKYLVLVLALVIFVLLIIGFFIFKKGIKFFMKVFNILLELICIGVVCFGLSYLGKTVEFLNGIKNKLYQIEEYDIVTLNTSTYSELKDIDKKQIGVYVDEINGNYNNTIIDLLNEHEVLLDEYEDYEKAAQALMDGKIEILFISANYRTLVQDSIEDFESKTKIIHKIEVKIKEADIAKEVNVSKEPFNIYVSGIDTRGKIETKSRSDVNMVITVNPDTNQVFMTSVPRDYYVQLHGTTGIKDKLTHAGMYGVKKSVETMEDLLNIDINYYVRVNFTSVIKLVDAMGGIEINSPQKFTSKVNKKCTYKKGKNTVSGACALAFVRERYAFEQGDVQRTKNQQEVIRAVITKAMNSKTIVSKYTQILESFAGSIDTNMPSDKIYELVKMQLATMPKWEIDGQTLKGYNSFDYCYSLSRSQKYYVMVPDEQSVSNAKKAIKKVINAVSESTMTGK